MKKLLIVIHAVVLGLLSLPASNANAAPSNTGTVPNRSGPSSVRPSPTPLNDVTDAQGKAAARDSALKLGALAFRRSSVPIHRLEAPPGASSGRVERGNETLSWNGASMTREVKLPNGSEHQLQSPVEGNKLHRRTTTPLGDKWKRVIDTRASEQFPLFGPSRLQRTSTTVVRDVHPYHIWGKNVHVIKIGNTFTGRTKVKVTSALQGTHGAQHIAVATLTGKPGEEPKVKVKVKSHTFLP